MTGTITKQKTISVSNTFTVTMYIYLLYFKYKIHALFACTQFDFRDIKTKTNKELSYS